MIEKLQEKINICQKIWIYLFEELFTLKYICHTLTSPLSQQRTRPLVLCVPPLALIAIVTLTCSQIWNQDSFPKSFKTHKCFGYVKACSNYKHDPVPSAANETWCPTVFKWTFSLRKIPDRIVHQASQL